MRLELLVGIRPIGLPFRWLRIGAPNTDSEAIANRTPVSLADSVQVEAALIDLSLNIDQLRLNNALTLAPRGRTRGKRPSSHLQQRRQNKRVRNLNLRIKATLQRPRAPPQV